MVYIYISVVANLRPKNYMTIYMTICVNTTSWDSIPNWAAIVEHDPTAASHSWPSKKLEQSSSQRGLERPWAVGVGYHLSIVVGNEFHCKLRVCSYYKGSSNLPFNKNKTNLLLFFVIEMDWGDWLKKSLLQSNPNFLQNTPPKALQPPCPIKQHIFTPPAALVGYD